MKKYLTALVLAGGFAAAQSNAACTYPAAPGKLPDGTVATKEEMLAAKKLVTQYNTDVDAYLGCLDSEYQAKLASMPDATEEQKAEMLRVQNEKHNAAVDKVKEVADQFNEQLRAWKAKSAEKKTS
jgi:hypothetical protein